MQRGTHSPHNSKQKQQETNIKAPNPCCWLPCLEHLSQSPHLLHFRRDFVSIGEFLLKAKNNCSIGQFLCFYSSRTTATSKPHSTSRLTAFSLPIQTKQQPGSHASHCCVHHRGKNVCAPHTHSSSVLLISIHSTS